MCNSIEILVRTRDNRLINMNGPELEISAGTAFGIRSALSKKVHPFRYAKDKLWLIKEMDPAVAGYLSENAFDSDNSLQRNLGKLGCVLTWDALFLQSIEDAHAGKIDDWTDIELPELSNLIPFINNWLKITPLFTQGTPEYRFPGVGGRFNHLLNETLQSSLSGNSGHNSLSYYRGVQMTTGLYVGRAVRSSGIGQGAGNAVQSRVVPPALRIVT